MEISSSIHFPSELIDGQEVIVPDEEGWRQLRKQPKIRGVKLRVLEWIWGTLDLIRGNPLFRLGLVPHGGARPHHILPIVLLHVEERWQRVHLERLTCKACEWRGLTANPDIKDLYIGVPDKWDPLKRGARIPALPCPRCGSVLPGHPIWLEPGQFEPASGDLRRITSGSQLSFGDRGAALSAQCKAMLSDGSPLEDIVAFLREEQCFKVEAIQILMDAAQLGLRQAKDWVDSLQGWRQVT